ncbi:hypothetical protein Dxin01_03064 [Deinococcus xinjiangensis]|uniref:Homeodomain-like domain-containing protein n=1 Tax=Deinococcus xinjiangensis TaxID=457454 RepID=A0ABP9VDK8_9DEIO
MPHTPKPKRPPRRVSGTLKSLLAQTAEAHSLDLAKTPLLAAYIAAKGRWPSFVRRWGTTRLLEGNGPLARLVAEVGGDLSALAAVSILPDKAARAEVDAMPPAQAFRKMLAFPSEYAPKKGVLALEWSAKAGWHWEGVITRADLKRLEKGGFDVNARPVMGWAMLERQARYMTKGCRRDAAHWEKAAYAETFLGVLTGLELDRLPLRVLTFGPPAAELGHKTYGATTGRPPSGQKSEALKLSSLGQTSKEISTKLGVPLRTVQRWISAQPQPEAEAKAVPIPSSGRDDLTPSNPPNLGKELDIPYLAAPQFAPLQPPATCAPARYARPPPTRQIPDTDPRKLCAANWRQNP